MNYRRDRYQLALTPAGAGVLSLFFPGLVIAVVSQQQLLLAVSVGSGLSLIFNAVVSRRFIARLTMSVAGPVTATVDSVYPVTVGLERGRTLECAIAVDNGIRSWTPAAVPATGEVLVVAAERGVVERLGVRVRTAVPFGLIACVRISAVPLARPIHVGPKRVDVARSSIVGLDSPFDLASGDDPIGLRPYAVGDSLRDVHWPAVARTGAMIVRDRRVTNTGLELDVVVETDPPGCDLDDLLGRARSILEQLVTTGHRVRLVTAEAAIGSDGGFRVAKGWVGSADDIIQRLARTVIGPPGCGSGSVGGSARLVICPEGLRWLSPS